MRLLVTSDCESLVMTGHCFSASVARLGMCTQTFALGLGAQANENSEREIPAAWQGSRQETT